LLTATFKDLHIENSKNYKAVSSKHVSICSGLAAIFNATFLPASITHVRRIIVGLYIV